MIEQMAWPEFGALALVVADALGVRRHGEIWEVAEWHEDHAWPAATLEGTAGARLLMQFGHDAVGKVTITAKLPEGTYAGRGVKWSRNIGPQRGARAIAAAADTYVLRGGYLDVLSEKAAEKAARDAIRAARDAMTARAAALFGVPPPDDGKLSLSRFLPQRAQADFGQDGRQVSLALHGVPAGTALRILAILAEDTRASYCYSCEPGHHPDLSTAGCQREDSGRGHNASRLRVPRILISRGIDAELAGKLMDGAYRSAWGTHAEGTGITVAYDFDHQEWTVSLPRPEMTA